MNKQPINDPWHAHNTCAHIPNARLQAALDESDEIIRQIKAGERVPFDSVEEFLADLYSEDADDDDDEV